ncbi:MAG: DUF4126 domain-containing protein [Planctomycetaceae bacterium]|nr:DUF4126 domain-containing protein [Planctomycetaceae bacterium]
MDIALGICLGIGLSAACGFRVFVPMFFMSIAARAGYMDLAEGFDWMSSWGAVIAFGTATVLETGAYYIPWLDNLLDSATTPAAVIAGVVATAASITDADPLIQWSAALIGGGGVAGVVQSSSVALRAASTLSTGGLGNFVVATVEFVGSILMSILAMLLPVFAAVVAVGLTASALSLLFRRWNMPRASGPAGEI